LPCSAQQKPVLEVKYAQTGPDWQDWQWQLRHSIRSVADFHRVPELAAWWESISPENRQALRLILSVHQMGVTPYYLNLIQDYSPADPIFNQIIPSVSEKTITPDELTDPIGDNNPELGTQPAPAITHRYPDRVLFHPTSLCAVYCRFCFRKQLVGQSAFSADPRIMAAGYDYIRQHGEIEEVILTGGDPLMLSDRRLCSILKRLAGIDHIQRLRIHTRLPVVNPFRLSRNFAKILQDIRKPVRIVTHFNHPREISPVALDYLANLHARGIPVLNQTVLLRSVNAGPLILRELMLKLADAGIQPYYLHHPDKVRGTSHFRLTIEEGLAIYRALRLSLPGFAVPLYVLDVPGGYGKLPVDSDAVRRQPAGGYLIRTPHGLEILYTDS